jgi:hypothetical protein
MAESADLRPRQPIRRFDVFAETKRLEALAHGEPEDVAKGYGIRIAKVVASKRFGGASKKTHFDQTKPPARESAAAGQPGEREGEKFRALDGELQTDETFDREIIERMGPQFYDAVFAPAIQEALADGRKYEQIRDAIRKDWKPVRD